MTITAEKCLNWILNRVPGFRPSWDNHLKLWKDEKPGLGNNIAVFSDYVEEVIKTNRADDIKTIFDIIERLMAEGDEEVSTAVATNCLENIINRASEGAVNPEAFVQYLGKGSRAYCVAWDRFTGVRTPGLRNE